jgi:hypothetical protein
LSGAEGGGVIAGAAEGTAGLDLHAVVELGLVGGRSTQRAGVPASNYQWDEIRVGVEERVGGGEGGEEEAYEGRAQQVGFWKFHHNANSLTTDPLPMTDLDRWVRACCCSGSSSASCSWSPAQELPLLGGASWYSVEAISSMGILKRPTWQPLSPPPIYGNHEVTTGS